MKLYCFGQSGHSYKAALYLEMSPLEWQPEFVDFFNGETRDEKYLRSINTMGEVPVLIDGDTHLSQSGVILQYLIDKTGFMKSDDPYEVLRWVLWDNHKLSSVIGPVRFMQNFLPEDKRPEPIINWMGGRITAAMKTLDDHLEGRDWIVGDAPSAADLSCCSYLFYPESWGWDASTTPNINAWLDRIRALPGWKHPYDLMPTDQALLNATPSAAKWHK